MEVPGGDVEDPGFKVDEPKSGRERRYTSSLISDVLLLLPNYVVP